MTASCGINAFTCGCGYACNLASFTVFGESGKLLLVVGHKISSLSPAGAVGGGCVEVMVHMIIRAWEYVCDVLYCLYVMLLTTVEGEGKDRIVRNSDKLLLEKDIQQIISIE